MCDVVTFTNNSAAYPTYCHCAGSPQAQWVAYAGPAGMVGVLGRGYSCASNALHLCTAGSSTRSLSVVWSRLPTPLQILQEEMEHQTELVWRYMLDREIEAPDRFQVRGVMWARSYAGVIPSPAVHGFCAGSARCQSLGHVRWHQQADTSIALLMPTRRPSRPTVLQWQCYMHSR
jgi:hypothetical protein